MLELRTPSFLFCGKRGKGERCCCQCKMQPVREKEYYFSLIYDKILKGVSDVIKKELKESIAFYQGIIMRRVPEIVNKEEGTIEELEDLIKRIDRDIDKYLKIMVDQSIPKNMRKACELIKTGFYAISSTVMKPLLVFLKTGEGKIPPMRRLKDANVLYIKEAKRMI